MSFFNFGYLGGSWILWVLVFDSVGVFLLVGFDFFGDFFFSESYSLLSKIYGGVLC